MSLVTLIRDYADVANSSEILDGQTLSSLAYHTFIFLFTVAKQVIVYCFTFQWIRDFSYFCFTPPSIFSSFTNVSEIGKLVGVFTNDIGNLENHPFYHLFAFSDLNLSTGIGIVFLGFFNGCFSCVHFSAAHLVTIRRMLVQGVPAGLCSVFGTAVGQFFFLACVFFGFRGILFPWLALEPLQFLAGTGIILSVASSMAQDKRTPTIQWSAKSSLFFYGCINAALAWCEQAAIFQWAGNFSFGAEPTFLESTPSFKIEEYSLVSFGTFQQLAQNYSYLLSFFLGSVIGASFFAFLLQRILELILRYKKIAIYYGLIKQANLPLATLIFAFGFGSIPYYGLDYLITKGFGFVPQEKFFKQTLFSPINLVSKTSQSKDSSQSRLEDQLALFFTLEGEKSKSFAVDTTPFDDGQYLKISQKRPQAFEDLNYRGEHLWTNRLSRISNIREQANQTQSSFLGPIFSWMRSFLWGDEPTTVGNQLAQRKTNSEFSESAPSLQPTVSASSVPLRGKHNQSYSLNSEKNQTADYANKFVTDNATEINDNHNMFSTLESRKHELSPEMEQHDNYLKEFDRYFDKGFSNFYDTDPHSLIEVEDQWQEKRIKEKCYTNPIYKFLLNREIDAFLGRQPKSHWLSPQEENLLLKRRQLLSDYYDTLALTNQVSTSAALEQLVPKSYANTIYNHQFKGTLKTARRLFSIKRDDAPKVQQRDSYTSFLSENSQLANTTDAPSAKHEQNKIVKFDQPLFSKEKNNNQQILFHEELNVDPISPITSSFAMFNEVDQSRGKSTASQTEAKKSTGIKDNLLDKTNIFLLEQAESTPLYAGWDEELRKFIVTNKYQNRSIAGYTFSQDPKRFPENDSTGKTTVFTTWPIPNPIVHNISPTLLNENLMTTVLNSVVAPEVHKPLNSFSLQPRGVGGKKVEENVSKTEKSSVSQKNDLKSILTNHNKIFKSNNNFLFQSRPVTNDMANALLQWQKLIQENKQLSREDKQVAKERISYWPSNIRRANWYNEAFDNEIEFEEPAENVLKKKATLWEFTPPSHGGFIWSGSK